MSGSLAESELRGLARPGTENARQAVVRSPFRDAMRKLFTNKLAIVGMLMIGTVILVAFLAPWIASQHPDDNGVYEAFPRNNKQPPSIEHPMGTDVIGRDMLSLIIYGARISLVVGVFAVSLAIILGVSLEAIPKSAVYCLDIYCRQSGCGRFVWLVQSQDSVQLTHVWFIG